MIQSLPNPILVVTCFALLHAALGASALSQEDAPRNRAGRRTAAELESLREEVRGLRDDVRRLSALLEKRMALKYVPEVKPVDPETRRIQNALSKQVSVDGESSLQDVVRHIGELIEVNVVVDARSLAEEGRKATERVAIMVDGISARSALKLILEPLGLAYVIEDEVLKIVSRQRARGELTVLTYSVADLLPMVIEAAEKETPLSTGERNAKGFESLIQVIRSTVAPETWDEVGGRASIRAHELSCSLVIRQTADAHTEIQDLLQQIRRVKRLPRADGPLSPVELVVKVYAVADLVIPIPSVPGHRTTHDTTDWLKLIDRILAEIEPGNWVANGGECSIEVQEKSLSLIIRATPAMHQSLASLLNQMRRDLDMQISLSFKLLRSIEDSDLETAGIRPDFDLRQGAIRLGEDEAERLMKIVEVNSRDRVAYAPKVTIFDGQIARIGSDPNDLKSDPGFALHVRGHVNKDGRGVRLNVAVNPKSVASELARTSYSLADGGYLLLDVSDRLPAGSDRGGEAGALKGARRRQMVLLQSRIIVPEEETPIAVPSPGK